MGCLEVVLALSLHFGLDQNYNNLHPGIRCNYKQTTIGSFYNSERNLSSYLSRKIKVGEGVFEVGAATGYHLSVVPFIRYVKGKFFIMPAYEKTSLGKNYGLVLGWEF